MSASLLSNAVPKEELSQPGSEAAPMYFLHIPKTAGTSFKSFLQDHFASHEVAPAHLWRQMVSIPAPEVASAKLIWGHFYCFLDRHVPNRMKYLVFLRDPIDRALSHYGHVMTDSHHYMHQRAVELGSLGAVLDDPVLATVVTNFQVRSLSLDLDPIAMSKGLTESDLSAGELERRLETAPFDRSTNGLLDIAKQRLGQMCFIGITERYDESVELFCRRFRWSQPPSAAPMNVNPYRPSRMQISPEEMRRLSAANEADQALYLYACELFAADSMHSR